MNSLPYMDCVIRAILPDNQERLHYLLQKCATVKIFSGPHEDLFTLIAKHHDITGCILDNNALAKVIELAPDDKWPVERKAELTQVWERVASHPPVSEPDFRTTIELLSERYKTEKFGEILVDASKIISGGKKLSDRVILHGLSDAVDFISEGLADLSYADTGLMPEGVVNDEVNDLLEELTSGGSITRFLSNIVPIDDFSNGGPGTGELWLVAAYTGVGKSTLCINMAHSFTLQGKNVLYISMETQRSQIRRRLIARHSYEMATNPDYSEYDVRPLSLIALNKHKPPHAITLTDKNISDYERVSKDFASSTGKMIIAQVPDQSSMSTIKAVANRWNQRHPVDVIILDSIDLIGADRKRSSKLDELNEVIGACKSLAMSFDEGRGVPVISPWQINRDGEKRVTQEKETEYVLRDLALSAEAERKSDCILALMEHRSKQNKLQAHVLKFRDGRPNEKFELDTKLDHSYIGSKQSLDYDYDSSFMPEVLL